MKYKRRKAGNKFDALVAETVFDDKFEFHKSFDGFYRPWAEDPIAFEPCPNYSTDISAAWKVAEKLLPLLPHQDFHIKHWQDSENTALGWQVSSCYELGKWKDWTKAKTLPKAICLAALKALEK
jgi:hypothetical protein